MAQPKNHHGKSHLQEAYEDPKRAERLEREESKRNRKESIQNARKRQAIFGCRL